MRVCSFLVAVVATVGATTSAEAAPSAARLAHAGPTLTLSVASDQENAGVAFIGSFSSAHLPGGSTLYMQKQVGTARVWQDESRLRGPAGSLSIAGAAMGVHAFRLVAIHRRRLVAVSATKDLYSYGPVTMTTICRAINVPCTSGTETIGNTLYEYAGGPYAPGNTYPEWEQNGTFKADHTTCRNAVITFAFYKVPTTGRAYIRLLQGHSEPEEAATNLPTEVGTFNATFDGGSWYLSEATTNGTNVVTNGVFSCYTPTGL